MVKRAALCVLLVCSVSCRAAEPQSSLVQDRSPTLQRAASYRAMVYTSEFAERFSLPKGGVQNLDPGLHAVVLRIVERVEDHPGCYLDFYVDDALDLAFPEGSEGVLSKEDFENPYFFVRDARTLGAEGHRWDARTGSFHAVACREDPKNCMVEESGPHAYARHLMPGIAFQSYAVMCSALDPNNGPTEMWMLRTGRDAKELQVQRSAETATYRFAIPSVLFQHAATRTRQATKFYTDNPVGPEPERGQFTVPGTQ